MDFGAQCDFELTRGFDDVAIDKKLLRRLRRSQYRSAREDVVGDVTLKRLRGPHAAEVANDLHGRAMNPKHLELSGLVLEAREWTEVEAHLINRAGRDREVVAHAPFVTVVERNAATPPGRHAANRLATDQRASDASKKRLSGDRRGWFRRTVVLAEETAHDACAEEEAVLIADFHHVALNVFERTGRALVVSPNEPREQTLRPPDARPDAVGDCVHRAATKERDLGQGHALVNIDKSGEGDVIRSVATADAEHLNVQTLEVFCDAMQLINRVGFADHAVIAQSVGESSCGLGIAKVTAALGIEYDSDTLHACPCSFIRQVLRQLGVFDKNGYGRA